MTRDELYHYGILGMKWGHRKADNRESSNYFRARAAKLDEEKLTKEKPKSKPKSKPKNTVADNGKTLSEMNDEELRNYLNRKDLEKRYYAYHPNESKGEAFINGILKDVVKPATTDASKQLLKDYLVKVGNEALKAKTTSKQK